MLSFLRSTKDLFSSQLPMRSSESLRALLLKLVVTRVLVVSILLGAAAWSVLSNNTSKISILSCWIIAATYAASLVNAYAIRRFNRVMLLGYAQLFVDVMLASAAIYLTGGSGSPSVVLYLLVILGAAVVFSREGAVIIAAVSGLFYAIIASDLLPRIAEDYRPAAPQHILGVYLSLVVLAVVAGSFAKQLERLLGDNTRQARDLSELSNQQKQLFDDIGEGIVVVGLNGEVLTVNRSACSILGLSLNDASHLVGRKLPDLVKATGIENGSQLFERSPTDQTREVVIKHPGLGRDLCLHYKVRPYTDVTGAEVGRIIVFDDVSHVRSIEKRLSLHEEWTKLMARDDSPQEDTSDHPARTMMIGESPVMRQVFALVDRIATSEATVLITGESGTGKELIAKAIHVGSRRSQKPFVAINCGAIPENLIESELFGHKKGSFTGAINDKPGLFRQANGGTIFLDEIGELHPLMQTKLLRVLQEKTIRPVGDVVDYQVDVRVISATNRDLKREISSGGFREDLYYRLNVVNVVVPPLRDRREDIPLLVRFFIGRYADPSRILPNVSPEALQLLSGYAYPGNIRELENIIERALVLGGQAILPDHLPDELRIASGRQPFGSVDPQFSVTEILELPMDLEQELARIETIYLQQALAASGGIKKQAAELLGLNFRSFRYRLKKYGMGGEQLGD